MNLTLRTLLAYLDDTLAPHEAKEIGQKVAESEVAQELIERIKKVTRRRGLAAPPLAGGSGLDPNTVAEYLDNQLGADVVGSVEQASLDSDVHLAEIAACHQILSLVEGEQAHVPPTARQRMYRLVRGRESIPYRRPPDAVPAGGFDAADHPHEGHDADRTLLLGLPALGRESSSGRRFVSVVAILGLLILLTLVIRQAIPPSLPPGPQTATEVAALPPDKAGGDAAIKVDPKNEPEAKKVEPEPKTDPELKKEPEGKKVDPEGKKEPEGKKVEPEPKKVEPEPKKAPLVEKKDEPNPARFDVARMQSDQQVLLAQQGEAWQRVLAGRNVGSTDRLVALPGFQCDLRLLTGLQMTLWGNLPDFLRVPHLESQGVLYIPPEGFDVDFRLLNGRAFVSNPNAKPAKVRLRVKGELWDVTLGEKAEAVVDLFHRYAPGTPFSPQPGGESPRVEASVTVLKGAASVKIGEREIALDKGPAQIAWDNKSGKVSDPVVVDEKSLAFWSKTVPPKSPFRDATTDLERRLRTKDFLLDVVFVSPLSGSDRRERQYLAVMCMQATDLIDDVVDALNNEESPEARIGAVIALRHWTAVEPERDLKLHALLTDQKRFTPEEATRTLQLLHLFAQDVILKPETLLDLVQTLKHPKVALRELAISHLVQVDEEGPAAVRYDPAASAAERDRAADAWQKRIQKLLQMKK